MMFKNTKKLISLLLAIMMVVCLFGCKKVETPTEDQTQPENATEEVKLGTANPLTGTDDLDKSAIGKRPVAIMVENAPAARPQWGLGSPDITIEGLVEGGITRMLWVYADVNTMPKVGPCRSARIDFVEMAEGLDALYTHFGGAATAYDAMKARGVDDLDGGNNAASAFARDKSRMSRGSEHTAYTTGENMAAVIAKLGRRTDINTAYAKPFAFNEKATALSGGNCASIGITFSSSYKHTFKYNTEDKLYYNFMNTSEMVDENGKQMSVTNVIVLYYPSHSYIASSKNQASIDMDLSGGKGIVASNGTYAEITWSKGGPTDMLKLFDADGNEFKLNKGKSYIAYIPASNAGSTTIA